MVFTVAAFVQIGEGAQGLPEDPYLPQASHICLLGKGKNEIWGVVDGPFRVVLKTRQPDMHVTHQPTVPWWQQLPRLASSGHRRQLPIPCLIPLI